MSIIKSTIDTKWKPLASAEKKEKNMEIKKVYATAIQRKHGEQMVTRQTLTTTGLELFNLEFFR